MHELKKNQEQNVFEIKKKKTKKKGIGDTLVKNTRLEEKWVLAI